MYTVKLNTPEESDKLTTGQIDSEIPVEQDESSNYDHLRDGNYIGGLTIP
jgi:hypothetical protein